MNEYHLKLSLAVLKNNNKETGKERGSGTSGQDLNKVLLLVSPHYIKNVSYIVFYFY